MSQQSSVVDKSPNKAQEQKANQQQVQQQGEMGLSFLPAQHANPFENFTPPDNPQNNISKRIGSVTDRSPQQKITQLLRPEPEEEVENSVEESPVQRKAVSSNSSNAVIQRQDNEEGYIAVTSDTNLHLEPNITSTVIVELPAFTKVNMIAYNTADEWTQVSYDTGISTEMGYVMTSTLGSMMPEVEVVGEKLPLHRYDVLEKDCTVRSSIGGEKDGPVLSAGTRIFLINVPEKTWYYIRTEDGIFGYIPQWVVNGNMPDPGATLYTIKSGDTLEGIIDRHYKGFIKGKDRRFYANVLMYVNNPNNNKLKGIYKNGDFSVWHVVSEYNQYVVKEKLRIWIPSQGYADTLVNKVSSGSISTEIKRKTKEALLAPVQALIDRWWPEGYGINLEGGLGVTFGIPVGADIDVLTHFYRKDNDTIALRKSAKLRAGLDTGVGAGLYLGMKGSYGIGAEAGANAEVKAGLFNYLEFEFPFKEDLSLLSLMIAMKGEGSSMAAIASFLDMFFTLGLSPIQYLKKSKQAFGVNAKASALAQAGLRTGKEGQKYARSYGKDNSAPEDAASAPSNFLLKKLNKSVHGLLEAEGNVGVEMEVKKSVKNPRTDMLEPQQVEAEIFVEGKAAMSLPTFIPLLGNMKVDRGVGVKLRYAIDTSQSPDWQYQGKAFYLYSGEMDLYQGPADEIELASNEARVKSHKPDDLTNEIETAAKNEDTNSWGIQDLLDYIQHLKIKKRIMLSVPILSKYDKTRQKQEGVKRLMKQKYGNPKNWKDYGLSVSSYLTFEFDLGRGQIAEIRAIINRVLRQKITVGKIVKGIAEFLETGKIPSGAINDLLKVLFTKEALTSAEWFSILEIGFAGGAKLSAGAKARLDFNIAGGITHTMDSKDVILEYLNSNDDKLAFIRDLLNGLVSPQKTEKAEE